MKLLLLIAAVCRAETSIYKFRVHRNFVEEIFSKNLKLIFDHTDDLAEKEVHLPSVDSYLEKISLRVTGSKIIESEIIMEPS
jgi:hypothetical protein